MISLNKEIFIKVAQQNYGELVARLDRMFGRVFDRFDLVPLVVREFIDTINGSVVRSLPDGTKNPDKDYYFQKIDSSANTVTINAYGTQTINGSSSYTLSAQYDRVLLIWNTATQMWHIQ